MKRLFCIYLAVLGLLLNQAWAEEMADPLTPHLFPPELILQYQEEIQLTDGQREKIIGFVTEMQAAEPEAKAELEGHRRKLADLLRKEQIDIDAVLGELEKIQRKQAEQARRNIRLLLEIRKVLEPAQRERLSSFKKAGPGEYPPPALKQKLAKLQSNVQEWVSSGHDPLPISELMQEFEPLIRKGKLKEADALVSRALKMTEQ
jgi:Spy/CpxP family protein refolding chaperone